MRKAGRTSKRNAWLTTTLTLIFLQMSIDAHAGGKLSQERLARIRLAQSIEFYFMDHPATTNPPTQWADLSRDFPVNKINEGSLRRSDCYPLQQHYAFLTNEIAMPSYGGRLFVIGTTPRRSPGGGWFAPRGRYVIYGTPTNIFDDWLEEKVVQELFADTELPAPDLTSVPPPVARPESAITAWVLFLLAYGGMLYFFYRLQRRRR